MSLYGDCEENGRMLVMIMTPLGYVGFWPQVLGTDELNSYLNKYRLELDPHLEALVGRLVFILVVFVIP